MKRLIQTILVIFLLFSIHRTEANLPSSLTLTNQERFSLQYQLENLSNELEVMIHNQKSAQADIRKQERDISELKIFERIPFQEDISGLKKSLNESAALSQIKIQKFQRLSQNLTIPPMPKLVVKERGNYRPKPEQLVVEIPFKLQVNGTSRKVQKWINGLKENQVRLVEINLRGQPKSTANSFDSTWEIQGHAFQFRKIEFPQLAPPHPTDLLPNWAKANLQAFAKCEPRLWQLVTRSQKLLPKTPTPYDIRRQLLLNAARIDYFLSKAMPTFEKAS